MRTAIFAMGLMIVAGLAAGLWSTWPGQRSVTGAYIAEVVPWAVPDGIEKDQAASVFAAFRRHCGVWSRGAAERALGGEKALYGQRRDWRPVCKLARQVDDPAAFFRDNFLPVRIRATDGQSRLTGYFQPQYRGSLKQGGEYQTPVYGRPDDLVMVNLGRFQEEWRGRRLAGRIRDGQLVPYDDRAAIVGGALQGKVPVLAWLADPVDAFFMEIQGSGQILLPGDWVLNMGYAAQNGHAYRAIGRDLIEMGAVRREDMSMAAIRDWLTRHPDQAQEMMNRNRSYVFFRALNRKGAIGAAGRPLTGGVSIAVDRKFHALGVPMLLTSGGVTRLMLAEDTGGAIRGPVRADLYVGAGDEAGRIAGALNQPMALTILLPKLLAARLVAQSAD